MGSAHGRRKEQKIECKTFSINIMRQQAQQYFAKNSHVYWRNILNLKYSQRVEVYACVCVCIVMQNKHNLLCSVGRNRNRRWELREDNWWRRRCARRGTWPAARATRCWRTSWGWTRATRSGTTESLAEGDRRPPGRINAFARSNASTPTTSGKCWPGSEKAKTK